MESRFINYLDNFAAYVASKDDKKIKDILKHTYQCIADASSQENPQLSQLNRVFNSFPTSYSIESKGNKDIHYEAIDPAIRKAWKDKVQTIFEKYNFQATNMPGQVLTSPEAENAIRDLIGSMLIQATNDLLGKNGRLKEDVIKILGLSPLINANIDNDVKQTRIINEIILSYVVQLAFMNTADPFILEYGKKNKLDKAQESGRSFLLVHQLCSVKEQDSDHHIFTDFFQNRIQIGLAFKNKNWQEIIPVLMNAKYENLFVDSDIAAFQEQRHLIAQDLIKFLKNANYSPKDQNEIVTKVINGENALGTFLNKPTDPVLYKIAKTFISDKKTGSIIILGNYKKELEEELKSELKSSMVVKAPKKF